MLLNFGTTVVSLGMAKARESCACDMYDSFNAAFAKLLWPLVCGCCAFLLNQQLVFIMFQLVKLID